MKSRKLCAVVMTMVMASSTFIPVFASPAGASLTPEQMIIQALNEKSKNESSISKAGSEANINATDKVRIIVELEAVPVIDYAIQQGVSLDQLNKAFADKISDNLISTMDVVQSGIAKENINIEYHYEFVNVFNGFSATVTLEDAAKIEQMPNVKKVFISTEYEKPVMPEPDMNTSGDIVKTAQTWGEMGFKGEGMVVAVLDSSFAPEHPSMQLITDPSKAKYKSASEIDNIGLARGTWRNIKMPYAYNYYDNTQNLSSDSDHGTHVAGTVAANGDVNNGGIKGIAPEAQLLGMKVFGDDPSVSTTYDDIYVRAIEDALKLGADAINMSLGSTAGFVQPEADDPARVVIEKAADSGVVVNISAGNSNKFGSGYKDPYNFNPDYGVLGSPSVNPESFSVASVENTHMVVSTMLFKDKKIAYQESGTADMVATLGKVPTEYVDCGLGGDPAEFAGKVLAGKIALIQRGSYGFGVKILNAQNAGAKAVIIFNSAAGGDAVMGMAYGAEESAIKIPAVFMGMTNGLELKNTTGSAITFDGGTATISNPAKGTMSTFTSWGTTPNLDFKPEITAPGGQIYSTLQHNKYGLMSGTSMAAPHVSGGMALILQRIDKDYNLEGRDRYDLAKNLAMTTAEPLVDATGEFVSPRRQGAGVMNLYAATSGSAIVVDSTTQMSKVNLKEIKTNDISFTVQIKNFADKQMIYVPQLSVATDLVNGMSTPATTDDRILNYSVGIEGVTPEFYVNGAKLVGDEIVVTSNGAIDLTVKLNLDNAMVPTADTDASLLLSKVFPNGNFVEGFLRLKDKSDMSPTIGLPYMGFYGDWNKARIIDVEKTNPDNATKRFYGDLNGLLTIFEDGNDAFLGRGGDGTYKPENIAISPNGNDSKENVGAVFTFLRNAKSFEVKILDKDKNVVKELAKNSYLRKNYYDGKPENPKYIYKSDWNWDGTINNEVLEGQYYYQIKATLDYPGATPQEYLFPVMVDLKRPTVAITSFDKTTSKLVVKGTDNHKVNEYAIIVDDVAIFSGTGNFDLLGKVKPGVTYYVFAIDAAGNTAMTTLFYEAPSTETSERPVIDLQTPAVLDFQTTSDVLFKGTVQDPTGLKSLTIGGVTVPVTYDATTKLYNFSKVLTLQDGRHNPKVSATDLAGNNYTFERKFYVDSHAPVLSLNEVALPSVVESTVTKVTLDGTATDNYSGLQVRVNGSLISTQEGINDVDVIKSLTYDIHRDMMLKTGNNTIIVELKDGAGNVTSRTYNVYKKAVGEVISHSMTIDMPVVKNISSENPFSFVATSNDVANWTAKIIDSKNVLVKTYTATQTKGIAADWTPDADMKLNGVYTLEVSYVLGQETIKQTRTFEVYNYPLLIKELRVVKKAGFVTIEADVDSLSLNKQNPMLIIQVTDQSGRVKNISTAKLTGLGVGQAVTLSAGFASTDTGVYKVEAFVWTGLEGSKSLASPVTTQYVID